MPQYAPDVEAVMEAFRESLDSLKTSGPFQTITRIWQPWDQLASIAQPALVIVEPSEREDATIGRKSKITLGTQLVIYFRVDNQDSLNPPAKIANDLVRAIRQAILPRGSDLTRNVNTLGGLAAGVFINGRLVKDAGVLDEQASLLIPVDIILP